MVDRDYFRWDYEGGSSRPSFFATYPGTKGLLLTIVGIHVFLLILRVISLDAWAAVYGFLALEPDAVVEKLQIWRLVTATLVHDQTGITHILFNGIVLYWTGKMVESRIGTRRLLLFCGGAAVAASLAYVAWSIARLSIAPMVGASGAVLGLLVVCAFWYPNQTILLMFILPMPLWVAVAIAIFFDLLMMFSATSDVAHTAHLGGALYGWIYVRHGTRFRSIFQAIDDRAEKRRQQKEADRRRADAALREEVDRILDKVNREGMSALSDDERRFLRDASQRLRR